MLINHPPEVPPLGSSETFFLPDNCSERLLPLGGVSAAPLRARGVVLAGVSNIVPPYEIRRPKPGFHSLNMTISGRARFNSHATQHTFQEGDAWFVPASTACSYSVSKNDHWDIAWFHLADIDCRSPLRGHSPRLLVDTWPDTLRHAMECYIAESLGACPGSDSLAMHYAEIIGIYLDRMLLARNCNIGLHEISGLTRLWEKVNQALASPWDAQSLARELHVSPSHLYRLVRRHNNLSPMEMVTALRMNRAKQLLLLTDHTVCNIAEQVGYATTYSFSKAFKRSFGTSPLNYRNDAAG